MHKQKQNERQVNPLVHGKFTSEYNKYLSDFGIEDMDREGLIVQEFKKGEFLCEQGYPLDYFLLVVKGRIKVCSMGSNGKTLLFCYNDPGTILGEVEFMTHAFASSSVCAVTDVRCIAISHDRYREYLSSNIKFMSRICQTLANIVAETSTNGAFNILYPFESRLCAYIAMTHKNGCFDEKLTELAEFLGTSYRHLLRTLETLCRKGVIEKAQSGYVVKDALKLQTIGNKHYSMQKSIMK